MEKLSSQEIVAYIDDIRALEAAAKKAAKAGS